MEMDDDGYSLVRNKSQAKKERRREQRGAQLNKALAPRKEYFRLAFPQGTTPGKKLAWWGKFSSRSVSLSKSRESFVDAPSIDQKGLRFFSKFLRG